MANDSVENLTSRLRGGESVQVEVEGRDGSLLDAGTVQKKLEEIAGVSRVVFKQNRDSRSGFEVESLQGKNIRADIARAVVEAGWNLTELHAVGLSLEEIFLQLTSGDKK